MNTNDYTDFEIALLKFFEDDLSNKLFQEKLIDHFNTIREGDCFYAGLLLGSTIGKTSFVLLSGYRIVTMDVAVSEDEGCEISSKVLLLRDHIGMEVKNNGDKLDATLHFKPHSKIQISMHDSYVLWPVFVRRLNDVLNGRVPEGLGADEPSLYSGDSNVGFRSPEKA